MKRSVLFAAIFGAFILFITGCSQQQREEAQTTTAATSPAASKATSEAKAATQHAGQEVKQALSNGGLTTNVKAKLAKDVKLSTITRIDVDSADGVVTLKGHVPTDGDKRAAEFVAASVDGVTKVVNNLTVAP